jgi:hypothetical protein
LPIAAVNGQVCFIGEDMSILYFRTACAVALAAATSGCVTTMGETPTQQLEVHTILDHREVAGVGCVLSNAAGRWFVVAPGRVTVERSRSPLTIDCARAGTGDAREVAVAHATSFFDSDRLIGNIIVSAGGASYINANDGSGVAYQSTLTVLMHPAPAAAGTPEASGENGNVVF